MTKNDKCFFEHFKIDMDRVGLDVNSLKSEGVGITKYKNQSIIFQREASIEKYVSTFDDDMFRLMIFIDQYRGSDKSLPSMPSQNLMHRYHHNLMKLGYDNSIYKQALLILRDNDITSYNQFTRLVLSHKNLTDAQYIKSTRFGEKLEDWYFGDIHQYDGYKFVLNYEGFWELMHIQKGNGRPIVTFYDIKYVYHYLLNFYFDLGRVINSYNVI